MNSMFKVGDRVRYCTSIISAIDENVDWKGQTGTVLEVRKESLLVAPDDLYFYQSFVRGGTESKTWLDPHNHWKLIKATNKYLEIMI
jgi:hypothetical protein